MGDRAPQLSLQVFIEKEEDYYQNIFFVSSLLRTGLFELASYMNRQYAYIVISQITFNSDPHKMKRYSRTSCRLECSLKEALSKVECLPW